MTDVHPSGPAAESPEEVDRRYRYWRRRILLSTLVGYAVFYFVRKNLSFAMPGIEEDLGFSKAQLGIFLTVHGVLYGVSKFVNGMVGDRANPRIFMGVGLMLSAAMNVGFGMSSTAVALGVFWMFNGWFQGMGFPPCAKSLTHWFAPRERATKFAIWNTGHSIGAACIAFLAGHLCQHYGWRYAMIVPAGIAVVMALLLFWLLRDTPQSLGLPAIDVYDEQKRAREGGVGGPDSDAAVEGREGPGASGDGDGFGRFLVERVFRNPWVWLISVANFFVYTVRYAILDWGPTFLTETKGIDLEQAGWVVGGYEIAGLLGILSSGFLTDRLFRGHAARTCLIYMGLCSVCLVAFWRFGTSSVAVNGALLWGAGFFIYGPQCLVGVIAANLATRRAAASAIGLTGLFGYLSTILSGVVMGAQVDAHGWDRGFTILVGAGVVGTVLFAIAIASPDAGGRERD